MARIVAQSLLESSRLVSIDQKLAVAKRYSHGQWRIEAYRTGLSIY